MLASLLYMSTNVPRLSNGRSNELVPALMAYNSSKSYVEKGHGIWGQVLVLSNSHTMEYDDHTLKVGAHMTNDDVHTLVDVHSLTKGGVRDKLELVQELVCDKLALALLLAPDKLGQVLVLVAVGDMKVMKTVQVQGRERHDTLQLVAGGMSAVADEIHKQVRDVEHMHLAVGDHKLAPV